MITFNFFRYDHMWWMGSGSNMSGIRRDFYSSYWNYSSSIFKKSHKSDSDAQTKTLNHLMSNKYKNDQI